MATELNMTLLLRRAEFADTCVLKAGEPGYNTKTKEFKVGDGTTTWANLKVANETQIREWIADLETSLTNKITANTDKFANYYTKTEVDNLLSALRSSLEGQITAEATAREQADTDLQNQINTKLATETFNGHVNNDHAKTATEITAEIAAAVNGEKALREAADKDITDTIGTGFDKGDNTVAKKIAAAEKAAKDHAEAQASAAQSAAIAEAESKDATRAQAAATALSNAVSALESKISTGNSNTLQSAKDYTDAQVAAEAKLRSDADTALDNKITALRNEIGNLSNVMNFRGAVDAETDIVDPVEGDVITIKGTGVEKVYSAGAWIEIGTASATDAAVAALKDRMDAAEDDIDQAQTDIIALGTSKLDAATFNTWKSGFDTDKAAHESDHAKKQTEITADIATAKSEAITEAGKLDTALHTVISKEIDDDVKAAIDAEVIRANAAYDAAGSAAAAEANAKAYADRQDSALETALIGGDTDATYAKTIKGAKDFAAAKASAAETNAKAYTDTREVEIKKYADQAETDAIASAKSYTDGREAAITAAYEAYADQAETDAIAAVVGDANSDASSDTIKGVKKAYAAADVTVLNNAKAYADEKVTDAHKNYQTATVKDAAHDSATDPSFITSISIEKGHVTGATVRNLAEVLAAMEFIFDGGTSAN